MSKGTRQTTQILITFNNSSQMPYFINPQKMVTIINSSNLCFAQWQRDLKCTICAITGYA